MKASNSQGTPRKLIKLLFSNILTIFTYNEEEEKTMKALPNNILTQLSLVTMLLTCIAVPQASARSTSTELGRAILLKEINRDFGKAAKNLAGTLSDPAFRMLLWHEIQASRDKEKLLNFKDMYTRAKGHPDLAVSPQALLEQSQAVEATKKKMSAAKFPKKLVGVDLYFPVDSHRQQWRGDEELLVAFAPVQDESEVTSIIAYSVKTGEQVVLDPNEVPNVPTLMIAAKERPTRQPGLPVESLSQPPQQEDMDLFEIPISSHDSGNYLMSSLIGSHIGIPWLRMLRDHEPWWKGDPEIFILVGQSHKTAPQTSKIWLNDVNDEGSWYDLGDPGLLYFYFDEDYSDATYFHFMESDGGSSFTIKAGVSYQGANVGLEWKVGDDDDDLGSRYVNKDAVSLDGYITLSTGDVEFLVDKDQY